MPQSLPLNAKGHIVSLVATWRKFGSDPDFQHTSQGSTFAGDSFSLQFEGKSISYYAGINNGSVGEVLNASIVIDGGPPTFFVPGVQPEAVTTNNLIFNSGDLSEGDHTLVVTAENDHTVWTDYFLVTPNTGTPTSNPLPLTSGPSSPPTASTAASTSPPKTARSTPIGMIVGLVIVVVADFQHQKAGPMVEIIESAPAAQWRRSRAEAWPRPLSSEGHSPTISISTGPPLTSTEYSIVSPDSHIPSLADSVPQRNPTNVATGSNRDITEQ
ncbi:hypothetical protein B0H14DRAFT_3431428 [Mycena olivaceomarginata]|nr:hypothetical protein B0H14DRAFT_3431428 [Mycena olivaceomarginata]